MITFLKVTNNLEKVQTISDLSRSLFFEKKRTLIRAATQEAAKYIDDLLWKIPKEGFLPHELADSAIDEALIITTKETNLNQATVLVNLSPSFPKKEEYTQVFELLDETSEEKKSNSLSRLMTYKELGFQIS